MRGDDLSRRGFLKTAAATAVKAARGGDIARAAELAARIDRTKRFAAEHRVL